MDMNYNGVSDQQSSLGRQVIQPGTVLGNRFQVSSLLGSGGLGQLYRATDLDSKKDVALRIIAQDICQDSGIFDRFRQQVRSASMLKQKNIAAVFGMGKEGEFRFLAVEYIDGRSLRLLLEKKRKAGKTFSLKGAYNVLAHVCNALSTAHQSLVHGLLGPGSILVNRLGRVKVCEFGIARALPPGSNAIARLGDRYCIAPEMETDPDSASPRTDIYSLGIILYELLTGQAPSSPLSPPSSIIKGLSSEIDSVVARCLHHDPNDRYSSANELKAAFYGAVNQGDFEEVPSSQVSQASLPARKQGNQAAPPDKPQPTARQHDQPRPGQAPTSASGQIKQRKNVSMSPQSPPRQGPPGALPYQHGASPTSSVVSKTISIEELLSDVGDNDSEKWLIQKNRLDFGPFTLADLKQQLFKGEFSGEDVVVDQETGERNRIQNHPVLRDFMIHLNRHFESKRAQEAEVSRVQQDKRRRTILIAVVASCLAILGAGGALAAYYMTKDPETREVIKYREKEQNIADMLKGIQITWKKEPEDQAKRRRRLKRRRRTGKASGSSEDVTHLGDVSQAGGDALLSQKVVQQVMQKSFNKLTHCVYQELRRNAGLRNVLIEFGIQGSGSVSRVKVNKKSSGPFQLCIAGKMRRIKFPSFDGSLTRASFSMSLK